MKSIGIFFAAPGFLDPPFDEDVYRDAYTQLARVITQKGHICFILRDHATYQGGKLFSHGWKFVDNQFVEISESITIDVLYNKGEAFKSDPELPVINHPTLDALCRDKLATYKLFPEISPVTFLVTSAEEVPDVLQKIPTDWIVAKPIDGWGGHDVYIGERSGLHIPFYPFLIQAFIDMRKGIPGIVDSPHDYRIIVMNGRIAFSFVRVPGSGYVANTHQGGHILPVPMEKSPAPLKTFTDVVDTEFKQYGSRVYSIDCAYDADGTWKLIEINGQPGLRAFIACADGSDIYLEELVEALLTAI